MIDNAPKEWPTVTKWEQTLRDILSSLFDGATRFRDHKWKEVFENQLATTPLQTLKDTFTQQLPLFSLPLGEQKVEWTVWLDDEAVFARYATLSQIANLDQEKQGKVKKQVLEALKGDDTVRNEKGEIAVRGVTYLAWTSRV